MAALRPEDRGGYLGRRENRPREDREDEWYEFSYLPFSLPLDVPGKETTSANWALSKDEQLGQLYELMQAIQKRGKEGQDPE